MDATDSSNVVHDTIEVRSQILDERRSLVVAAPVLVAPRKAD